MDRSTRHQIYPNFVSIIDDNKFNTVPVSFFKRKIVYPFNYIAETKSIKSQPKLNSWTKLPKLENIFLDDQGLPYIPLK